MLFILSRMVCAMPLTWAMGLARAAGWFWYHILPVRRQVARRNVQRALGPMSKARREAIVKGAMQNLCCYVMEGLRMPALSEELSKELVDRTDFYLIDALLERGQGVIAVTAHIGNCDFLGTSQTVRGYPIHAIVKDIHWKSGHKFFESIRHRTGLGTIAPRRSKERIKELLGQNKVVAFLVDQHMARHRAIVCSFFDQLASTTPAPVRMAFETGAPILPIFMARQGPLGHHMIYTGPEFKLETPHEALADNIRHNTERLNRIVEGWIEAFPEQWLWLHKRWKVHDDPTGWDIPASLRHLLPPGVGTEAAQSEPNVGFEAQG